MTFLARSFLVWLMLLAIPFQGYASATMMLCAPNPGAHPAAHTQAGMPVVPQMAAVHDHAAMLAAQAADASTSSDHTGQANDAMHMGEGGHASGSAHATHGKGTHDSVKCGAAAACCIGAVLVSSTVPALAALDVDSEAIPFHSDFLPAVDLAHPERPPQGLHF